MYLRCPWHCPQLKEQVHLESGFLRRQLMKETASACCTPSITPGPLNSLAHLFPGHCEMWFTYNYDGIRSHHFRETDGETVETVSDFFLGGSRITAEGDCSHEIKRRLLLGRKVVTNLYGILKSRDITLSTKVRLVKAMLFPVVMYGCESWTVKKAERRRIDAFELWCWRRLLRVPWTARRSN